LIKTPPEALSHVLADPLFNEATNHDWLKQGPTSRYSKDPAIYFSFCFHLLCLDQSSDDSSQDQDLVALIPMTTVIVWPKVAMISLPVIEVAWPHRPRGTIS
jgi:hypothetical protein